MDWEPVLFFVSVVVIVVTIAALRHKERIALIKKGKNPYPLVAYPKTGRSALFIGLVAVAFGLALLISGFFVIEESNHPVTMVALICLFSGGASLIFWKLTAKDREESRSLYKKHLEKESKSHETDAAGEVAEDTEQSLNIGEN